MGKTFSPNKALTTADFPRLTKPKVAMRITFWSSLSKADFNPCKSWRTAACSSRLGGWEPWRSKLEYQDRACCKLARA